MGLEPIIRRSFREPDRAEVQERVTQEVERDPERFLAYYIADERSRGGRYANSDLMKETFQDYRQSREARNRFNAPLHNAAAVLASEQYRRAVADDSDPRRDTAILVTGVPGAGKTTYVLKGGEFPPYLRVLYEGQLSVPESAVSKIGHALAAGLFVQLVTVHIKPDQALQNTLRRFSTEGRGASIEAMASIQGRLPASLRVIQAQFGDAINFRIVDRRATITTELRGWEHLPELESEGTYEHIKQRLTNIVEREFSSGRISEKAYNQAIGRVPGNLA